MDPTKRDFLVQEAKHVLEGIVEHVLDGHKIQAVKLVCESTGLPLPICKNIVDGIELRKSSNVRFTRPVEQWNKVDKALVLCEKR